MEAYIRMPRVNANEDSAKIVGIECKVDESFAADAVLFSIETTKATVEIEAPVGGTISEILVELGEFYDIGRKIARVKFDGDVSDSDLDLEEINASGEETNLTSGQSRVVSKKASMRAKELGVDIDLIPARGGRVRLADVEEFSRHGGNNAAQPAAPAILRERYRPTDAIIFGGGGHGHTILDAVSNCGFRVIGAVDDKRPVGESLLDGCSVFGNSSLLTDFYERGVRTAFVGVGGAISNAARAKVFDQLKEIGFYLPPAVSDKGRVGAQSEIGEATYVLPGAMIGAKVSIGNNVIVNQGVQVCHDSIIGDHVHLTPNAVIAGACTIGDRSTIGMCATVMNGISIKEDCLVHNGVAVAKDIPKGTIVSKSDI